MTRASAPVIPAPSSRLPHPPDATAPTDWSRQRRDVNSLDHVGSLDGEQQRAAASLWDHTACAWFTDIGILLVLAVAYALITWWRLAKTGPARRR
jgi:hypothetical protein